MRTPSTSVAADVRHRVEVAGARTFLTTSEIPGTRPAVETALSRLVSHGDLIRVRHGLYWKGPKTRAGMPRPRPGEIAMRVAGVGSGPAGVTAARALGLTTQVPRIEEIAVPGRVPKPVDGVVFMSRSFARKIIGIRPIEVAVLETLRSWPTYSESSWSDLVAAVERRIGDGTIRPEKLTLALRSERSARARALWERLTAPPSFEPELRPTAGAIVPAARKRSREGRPYDPSR